MAGPQAIVPRLIKFSGALHDSSGKPLRGAVDVTFALYSMEAGGSPLWFETQSVQADELGRYTALLGAMHTEGLPMNLFTSGEVRWLGIQVGVEAEQQPRVLLVSVPYALKAGDAETLGGKPASAYMLSESQGATTSPGATVNTTGTATASGSGKNQTKSRTANTSPLTACTSVTGGGTATANHLSKFTTACNIEPSGIVESNGNLGIGTASPLRRLTLVDNVNKVQFELQSSSATTGPNLFLNNVGTVNGGKFLRSFNGNLQVVNSAYTSVLLNIQDGGNVGIGTTGPPTAKLEVNGTAKFDQPVTFAPGQNFSTTTGTVTATSGTFSEAITSKGLAVTADVTDTSSGSTYVSTNVVGGYTEGNSVTAGVTGATIAGGGGIVVDVAVPNSVTDDWGTVGGGYLNRAGNNAGTVFDHYGATVAGGNRNTASGIAATVAGGDNDTASGAYSTVAGGTTNTASGDYSFAAGCRAFAANQGAFVWADSSCAAFASTAPNQFLIKAAGGVGIGTNNPGGAMLAVAGNVVVSGGGVITGNGSGLTNLNATNLSTGTVPLGLISGLTNANIGGAIAAAKILGTAATLAAITNAFSGNIQVGNALVVDLATLNNGTAVNPGLTFGNGSGEGIASNRTSVANGNQFGLDFYTNFIRRLSISNAGNVGIGNPVPAKPLDVAGVGGMKISRTDSISSNNEILFQDNGQIRSADDNHRIIFDRANNILELREFGTVMFSSAAGAGARTAKMQVDAAGAVEIGTTTQNGSNLLTVNGSVAATAYNTTSSRRFKTNIRTIDGALEKINRLRGVTYDQKSDGKHQVGVIAEEVGQVVPEVVSYEKDGVTAQSVDYSRLTAVLIQATKEQQGQIRRLSRSNVRKDAQISAMNRQIEELCKAQVRMQALEARLDRLERQDKTTRTATAHSSAKSKKPAQTELARAGF